MAFTVRPITLAWTSAPVGDFGVAGSFRWGGEPGCDLDKHISLWPFRGKLYIPITLEFPSVTLSVAQGNDRVKNRAL